MKFDAICSILLENKKQQKYARIVVVNPDPTFSMEDILRDPDNSASGVKTYIDDKNSEDPERVARRALRRINWIAKSLVKRVGGRELDLRKLHKEIIRYVESYLGNIMRVPEEQLKADKFKIAKEAAFIGNLLLPPTEKTPRAKGVFDISKSTIPRDENAKNADERKFLSTAEYISKEFNMTVDEYINAFDPDLIETIKEIIADGSTRATDNTNDTNNSEPKPFDITSGLIGAKVNRNSIIQDIIEDIYKANDIEEAKDIAIERITSSHIPQGQKRRMLYNINSINSLNRLKSYLTNSMFMMAGMSNEKSQKESVGVSDDTLLTEAADWSDILKDPRIKGVYDPKIVKAAIKGMILIGTLQLDNEGNLEVAQSGTEEWRMGVKKARNKGDTEIMPSEEEIKDISDEIAGGEGITSNSSVEDEEEIDINVSKDMAARRLGYKKPVGTKSDDIEDSNEDDDIDEA